MAQTSISKLLLSARGSLPVSKALKFKLSTSAASFSGTIKVRDSDFWKKKFNHALRIQDTYKDGTISRKDFYLIIQRYIELGSTSEHLRKLQNSFQKCFDTWGLKNESTTLTHEEFGENFIKLLETVEELNPAVFVEMFELVDVDRDGRI